MTILRICSLICMVSFVLPATSSFAQAATGTTRSIAPLGVTQVAGLPRMRQQQEPAPRHKAPALATSPSLQSNITPSSAGLLLPSSNSSHPAAGETIGLLTTFTGSQIINSTPPDTQLAVGPDRLLEMVNVGGRIFDKSGNVIGTPDFDLRPFFDVAGTSTLPRVSDPKVLYDSESGHFFASIFFFDKCDPRPPPTGSGCTTYYNSEVYLAISQTTDPAGDWWVYQVQNNTSHILYDQPKIGVSSDKVLMSWNGYNLDATTNDESFAGTYEVVLQKNQLVSGATTSLVAFGPDNSRFNVMPVQSLSPTTTMYAVYHKDDTSISVLAYTGTPVGGNVAVTTTDIGVGEFKNPPAAEQPGMPDSSWLLDAGDSRLQTAIWSNNSLWTAATTACVPGEGDTNNRACIRFIQVTTSGGINLAQNTNLHLVNGYLFYPALTLDSAGNLWAGFTSSASTLYASATVGVVPGAQFPPVVGGVYYFQGSGPYCANVDTTVSPVRCVLTRWGDYSAAAVDPSNPLDIWVDQEYGSTSATDSRLWATGIGRFSLAGPTANSIIPSSGPERSSCIVTAQINGADFIPGGTSVRFGGIDASGVSVRTPEQLDVVVPAQPAGSVDVTVTTANGTSAIGDGMRFTYTPDTIAATSSAGLNPLSGTGGWNRDSVTVTLSAVDNTCGTGVQRITYSAVGAQTIPSTSIDGGVTSFVISANGITTVSFFATDIAGNVEAARTITVKIDRNRVLDGLQAFYDFNEGSGTIVHDNAGTANPLDLYSSSPLSITWLAGGLQLTAPTQLASAGPATSLIQAISGTNELSLEAWIQPATSGSNDLARVMTLSPNHSQRNFELRQDRATSTRIRYSGLLRTTTTESSAGNPLTTSSQVLSSTLQHIVYTRDALGVARLYVNGVERAQGTRSGSMGTWDTNYPLVLGNTLLGDRAWLGTYYFAAIYSRALSAAEVQQNFQSGSESETTPTIHTGTQVAYSFNEESGTTVFDQSGSASPINLTIPDPTRIRWNVGSLTVLSPTLLLSATPFTTFSTAARTTNEVSIEAWITPAASGQNSLGRIVTLSPNATQRNIELLQERSGNPARMSMTARLRTTTTSAAGSPALRTPQTIATTDLQHVVYTRDGDGVARIYIDGQLQATSTVGGNLSSWANDYYLVVANTFTADRPWLGTYDFLALYDRALSPAQVQQRFAQGPTE